MTRVWSAQQDDIFDWFKRGKGNLVIVARAGTGKTTTILEGISRAPEKRILTCAFNKTIAAELNSRLKNPNAEAKTLHALGFSCVKRFWERVNIGNDRAAKLAESVCGATAPDDIKRLVAKLHTHGREIAPFAKNLGDLTDIAYQFECDPDPDWEPYGYDMAYVEKRALEAMELAATVKTNEIDFADMIFLPVRNHWLARSYDLVVVDEAQDMTVAQLAIAQGMCRGRVCVVGDDRQAIYGFRGADSNSLNRLKQELNAAELKLTVTYRCKKQIVAEAAKIVPDFECGEGVADGQVGSLGVQELINTAQPGSFVLSRTNAPLVAVAMALLRSGKRTRVAGKDIGAGLRNLVRRLRAKSIPQLLEKLRAWEDRECARLTKAQRLARIEVVHDQAETLMVLALEAKSVEDLLRSIDALFADDGLGAAGVVTCSSVHKSKGLEADTVYILSATLRAGAIEEDNIRYVAITRAKNALFFVS